MVDPRCGGWGSSGGDVVELDEVEADRECRIFVAPDVENGGGGDAGFEDFEGGVGEVGGKPQGIGAVGGAGPMELDGRFAMRIGNCGETEEGVGVQGIGSGEVFFEVGIPVAIVVLMGDGVGGTTEKGKFPPVGKAIAVGVEGELGGGIASVDDFDGVDFEFPAVKDSGVEGKDIGNAEPPKAVGRFSVEGGEWGFGLVGSGKRGGSGSDGGGSLVVEDGVEEFRASAIAVAVVFAAAAAAISEKDFGSVGMLKSDDHVGVPGVVDAEARNDFLDGAEAGLVNEEFGIDGLVVENVLGNVGGEEGGGGGVEVGGGTGGKGFGEVALSAGMLKDDVEFDGRTADPVGGEVEDKAGGAGHDASGIDEGDVNDGLFD